MISKLFPNKKKNVGISYHKCNTGSTHQQEEESKNNGGKIKSAIKKKKKANKEVVVDLELHLDFGKKEA